MELVVTDSTGRDAAMLDDFELDLAYGDDGNDFALSCVYKIEPGALAYIDGTDYGGVVDTDGAEVSRSGRRRTYSGRTWHGVLASKVLEPNTGTDYLDVSGEANVVLLSLIARMGLSGMFTAPLSDSGIRVSHRFERYTDGWSGVRKMLKASGARPEMVIRRGFVELSAVPIKDHTSEVDSDIMSFDITRTHRTYNHLICLGSGELATRAVVHWYADAAGNVSRVQSLFGLDEIAAVYDYSNADAEELEEEGCKKLAKMQGQGSIKVRVDTSVEFGVGDTVSARDNEFGVTVSADVARKVVKVSHGVAKVEYEMGSSTSSKSLTGSSESSGASAAYSAGEGIRIVGRTIMADVTSADLASTHELAAEAKGQASNAVADAASCVQVISAASPITAVRSGRTVSLGHEASGVVAGAYGPMSNLSPTFGATVSIGPRTSVSAAGHVTGMDGRTLTIPSAEATQAARGLMSASDKKRIDAYPWASIVGVPESFPPTYHSHDDRYYTEVETDEKLAGKAASSHNHDAAYAASSHTHRYAGSSSPGGAADNAVRLETARTITFEGAVSGSLSFDGSSDETVTLQGDSEAASFLAANPVGHVVQTCTHESPEGKYGGAWRELPTMAGFKWLREN